MLITNMLRNNATAMFSAALRGLGIGAALGALVGLIGGWITLELFDVFFPVVYQPNKAPADSNLLVPFFMSALLLITCPFVGALLAVSSVFSRRKFVIISAAIIAGLLQPFLFVGATRPVDLRSYAFFAVNTLGASLLIGLMTHRFVQKAQPTNAALIRAAHKAHGSG